MSDSRAFIKRIDPVGAGKDENNAVHQASPAWVLTFVRWENRDTLRTPNVVSTDVRDPMVIENDCISVTTNASKGTLTPSMSATLLMTDINYETAVAPGDFVFVNMLNWPSDARKVADKARARQAINGVKDGFKGVFKVQGVRRFLTTDPNTGTKMILFKIDGFAFTEFNNTIYFNPYLVDPQQDPKNQLLFASFIGRDWSSLVNEKGLVNVQDVIAVLIQSLIGTGLAEGQQATGLKSSAIQTKNTHFFVPELVGTLLGVRGAKAAKDIYVYLFGIQKYAGGSSASLAVGMNPTGLSEKFDRFFYTSAPCSGSSLLKPEYWNQVKTWSILNQYTNAPLNEMYTCFRVSPSGRVMPTLVFRQIPFSTEDFGSAGASAQVTRFLNLPRWKVNTSLIVDQDIGRDESARVNFVQYFGRSTLGAEGADIAQEIAQGNYVYDIKDVQRSGLRPYIITTQFDDPTSSNKEYRSPMWAKIVGDALIGGHLKLNGSIQTAGLVDPVAVGDNLELDGTVYHIEQVSHNCSINVKEGKKIFRTNLKLSSGVSTSSSVKGTRYAEMDHPGANDLRKTDYQNNQILPGVAEGQDVIYRPTNTDYPPSTAKSFPQPKTRSGNDSDNGDST